MFFSGVGKSLCPDFKGGEILFISKKRKPFVFSKDRKLFVVSKEH